MILDLNSLNNVQKSAVECIYGPIIVSAGAGSGKTRVLTYRVANLIINHRVPPYNILAITFTNKAAKEMRTRLENMLDVFDSTICTFHALGVKILRECHQYIEPRTKYFSIYDEADKKSVFKNILTELNEDKKMLDYFMECVSKAKNAGISPSEYAQINQYYSKANTIAKIYEKYEIAMANNNAYDFDDLLCKPFELLKQNQYLREFYQDRFKFILVDEFQDTNEIQYNFLKLLAGKDRNLFVVGDEDQSIYSWRGADSKNMMKFIEDFNCNQIFKLEQNYRSSDKILNAANLIISKNKNRLEKKLWTNLENGLDVEYKGNPNEHNEAEFVARKIATLSYNGTSYNKIAVLVRMNALTRVLEDKFLEYNIPYRIFGGVKFYERSEVKNILAYLKCISNTKDNESFLRIINFPKRKIGDVAISNLKNLGYSNSLMETLLLLNENALLPKGQLDAFLKVKELFVNLISKAEESTVTDLIKYLFEQIDLENIYDKDNEEEYSRLLNIQELENAIKEFVHHNPDATLNDYLQAVTLSTDIDSYESEDDSVTIATVHAVKGLEFDNVFIVGLQENIFPLIRMDTISYDESMEEERRLMYVAITRAKNKLILTNSISRALHGKREDFPPSRFLKDLGYVKPIERKISFDSSYNGEIKYNNYQNKSYGYNDYSSVNEASDNYFKSIDKTNSLNKYEKDFLNSKPQKTQSGKSYKNGQKVVHPKFGKGVIINVNETTSSVSVAFEGLGIKNLDINFAKLEIV